MTEQTTKKQLGMFRLSGAGVLALVVGGTAAAGYFGAGPITKSILSSSLEKAIGAENNIESVQYQLQPFGIKINGLQQTDPDNLSQNLFEFKQASASLNVWELMLGQVLIEELKVDSLTFNTERTTAGELYVPEAVHTEDSTSTISDFKNSIKVPSKDELLAKADLITEKKAKQLQTVWTSEKENVEQSLKNLPSKDSLKKYETQWQAIQNSEIKSLEDLEALKAKIKQLKADISKDKEAVAQIKSQYKTSKSNLDTAYSELKAAPAQDWSNIKEQLPIDDPSALAISKLLFGDEITGYITKAEEIYKTLKPFIDANREAKEQDKLSADLLTQGRDIDFTLVEKWPSWMVKSLLIDVIAPDGKAYRVEGNEINVESYVRNKPSLYSVNLVNMDGSEESFELSGQYFVDKASEFTSKGKWQLKNMAVDGKSLSKNKQMSLTMDQSLLNGDGTFAWQDKLESNHKLKFKNVKMSGEGDSQLANLTLDTLTKVSSFNLDIGVKGSLSSPSVSISSDLDNQLNSAFKEQVSERWDALQVETKQALKDKLTASLNSNSGNLEKFESLKAKLDNAEEEFKKYGKEQLDKLISDKKEALEKKLKDKAEQELKDKLKDKLKGKFKGFGI